MGRELSVNCLKAPTQRVNNSHEIITFHSFFYAYRSLRGNFVGDVEALSSNVDNI